MHDDNTPLITQHVRYMQRRNLRPTTIYARSRLLRRLGTAHPHLPLVELTGDQIATWFDTRSTHVTPGTIATEVSHLRQFYDWATQTHGARTPMTYVVRPRLHRRLPRPMPDEDVRRAIVGAPPRIHPILMLATYAGFRACEIAQARGEHAILDGAAPVMVVDVGKGGGMSTVPLHPELVQMLRTLPRHGYLVPRLDGRPGQTAPHRISHLANTYLHQIGITHTLHTLRHWFGTNLYQASGRDLRTTQEGMRHESIASTVGYTWISPGAVAAAVHDLPVIAPRARHVA